MTARAGAPSWSLDLTQAELLGARRAWSCCDCSRQAIGAPGEPEVHLRARLVACGWTYERLAIDSQPTGRAWCPRHDPIRRAPALPPGLTVRPLPSISLSAPGSPFVRTSP